MSESFFSQGGESSADLNALEQDLEQREATVALAIARLKDGTGRRSEHADLVAQAGPYMQDLASATYEHLRAASSEMSEAELRVELRDHLVGSVIRTKAAALAQHHFSSPVEKARHYFELNKRSRILGGLATSAALFGATGLAVKGVEMTPLYDISEDALESLRDVRGVAAVTAGVIVARPWHIATAAIARMSRYKARHTARTGLNKHDLAVTSTLEERTAHITDKNERIKARYTILATEDYMPRARTVISDVLFAKGVSEEELEGTVQVGARGAVGWLYEVSGVDAGKATGSRIGRAGRQSKNALSGTMDSV